MQKVSLIPGTVVYFYLREGAHTDGALWPGPGIVYKVHSEIRVDIAVFGMQGPVNFERVDFCDEDQPKYHHWTFPPHIIVPAHLERRR